MQKVDTKTKILNAAEQLFAERGYADTSLRLITSQAEVNLASVNYHFGSKKELIQAVLARYLEVCAPSLEQSLAVLNKSDVPFTQHDVFNCLLAPLLELNTFRHRGTSIFLQLLGRGYIENQGHLRWFITTHYGKVLTAFNKAVQDANPDLSKEEIFWRLHFTLGTVVFTMASSKALIDIAKADFDVDVDIEGLIKRVVPFISSGVSAGGTLP
ncbi:TetR/AcrR family transcriptional regulator [Psychrobium sp. 1_MG-2023]|uniref:TetR/AcrR family transcriptional regulator n=1 Tax=Psychrobium sp. 1_MG-2023 TaxID=3062624 RepID=UPI002685B844|nr:TetR/AcrR family transcriptional regulator [Psychrobium sp. 1_MG-2023]MDP2561532.1 TetR/AcrR family transcriptional regulator [Psychrobium sp. 1_MG-2023]